MRRTPTIPRARFSHCAWHQADEQQRKRILPAASAGVRWLLELQNSDGGWPVFDRGPGRLPFDSSGSDLTAHALRALHAWRADVTEELQVPLKREQFDRRIAWALEAGLRHLVATQQRDGSWLPLRFGNPFRPQGDNPIYGTSRVLLALRDLQRLDSPSPRRALDWLVSTQRADGSFVANTATGPASVEETALAVEALVSCSQAQAHDDAAIKGLKWLTDAVEANRHTESSPIGLYFGKLWYYERLYPLIMSTAAAWPGGSQIPAGRSTPSGGTFQQGLNCRAAHRLIRVRKRSVVGIAHVRDRNERRPTPLHLAMPVSCPL